MRQLLAAMLDSEKNRCVLCRGHEPTSRLFAVPLKRLKGTSSGTIVGTTSPRKPRCRIYLAFSRGEVAERLKAAVC